MKLLVLVGSDRADSFNAQLADVIVREFPADTQVSSFPISTLPFFSQDAEATGAQGPVVAEFAAAVKDADALLVVSPAYNGGVTAPIKNAIDTASRPHGAGPIVGKPVAVAAAVFTPAAGDRVVEQLTTSLTVAGAKPLAEGINVHLAEHGLSADGIADAGINEQIKKLVANLVEAAK